MEVKWISVDKKLPEDDNVVLITLDPEHGTVRSVVNGRYSCGKWVTPSFVPTEERYPHCKVTAWMPTIRPYTGDEE